MSNLPVASPILLDGSGASVQPNGQRETGLPFSQRNLANPGTPPPPKCRRHDYRLTYGDSFVKHMACLRCGKDWSPAASRRGKSNARLGKDQERRIERTYGPRKVGEYGDAIDLLGFVWKWQSKATRDLPPLWMTAITEPQSRDSLPAWITVPMGRMDPLAPSLMPLLIASYVHQGRPVADWIFVRGADWTAIHGGSWGAYVVMSGIDWLDVHGRDDPEGSAE